MLITSLLTLLGLAVGLWGGEPLLYGVIGFLLGRVIVLDLALQALTHWITAQHRGQGDLASGTAPPMAEQPAHRGQVIADHPSSGVAGAPPPPASGTPALDPALSDPLSLDLDWVRDTYSPATRATADQPTDNAPRRTATGGAGVDWIIALRDWFLGGNLFVRVGILLVFCGVGFLIKYAVDQDWLVFTLEWRLSALAAAGLGLLGLGWSLRARRRDYALLLQGAAIGILYLDVYGAYQLGQLLSATPAFLLLTLIGLTAAGLAVIQNAPSLAWFGFAGGFLAPIVANSGRDDHVALFSYYALLNATILAVAWFRSWRALNLLGFGFTFGIAAIWGVLRYDPSRFATTAPFLLLFFLFYVTITILHALRQPPRLRGLVDATLLFGTPLLTFTCQVELVRHIENGIAWSAFLMGLFYLALGRGLPRLTGPGLALLAQAFTALGVIFLSVAVPFALANDTTAGFWALEGAGLVWIGARQRRPFIRAFGLLLQAGAAIALVAGLPDSDAPAFRNSGYLAAVMIGLAGMVSAYWLDREGHERATWERGGAAWLLVWGLTWWWGAGLTELLRTQADSAVPAGLLWYGILGLLTAELAASRLVWPRLERVLAALPLLGLAALALSLPWVAHPALDGGASAWPAYGVTGYLILFRTESRADHPLLAWSHFILALVCLAVIHWELVWRLLEQIGLLQGWRIAAIALVPLFALPLVTLERGWPLARWRSVYGIGVGGVLALTLLLWSVWSVASSGGSAPLPWLPLLNPADVMLALVILTLASWWRNLCTRGLIEPGQDLRRLAHIILGALAFVWINLVLLRTLHHGWGIGYAPDLLFRSDLVQTAVAVLWGLVGVGLLLVARMRRSRPLWMGAALILAAVVVKLFLIDLAASGTVERIVSFLAVGGLLVGIGWWSPLPPRDHEPRQVRHSSDR